MDVDAKLVQESGHLPTKLSPPERVDLASITQHPGVEVLIGKISKVHIDQQMNRIHKIKLDDADRLTKLDAICSVAQGMTLMWEILKMELMHNWKELQDQETARKREAENEPGS